MQTQPPPPPSVLDSYLCYRGGKITFDAHQVDVLRTGGGDGGPTSRTVLAMYGRKQFLDPLIFLFL